MPQTSSTGKLQPAPQSLSKPQALLLQPVLLRQEDWPRREGLSSVQGTVSCHRGCHVSRPGEAAKHPDAPAWPHSKNPNSERRWVRRRAGLGGWDQALWGLHPHLLGSFISICCRISCSSSSVLLGEDVSVLQLCLLGGSSATLGAPSCISSAGSLGEGVMR